METTVAGTKSATFHREIPPILELVVIMAEIFLPVIMITCQRCCESVLLVLL